MGDQTLEEISRSGPRSPYLKIFKTLLNKALSNFMELV